MREPLWICLVLAAAQPGCAASIVATTDEKAGEPRGGLVEYLGGPAEALQRDAALREIQSYCGQLPFSVEESGERVVQMYMGETPTRREVWIRLRFQCTEDGPNPSG